MDHADNAEDEELDSSDEESNDNKEGLNLVIRTILTMISIILMQHKHNEQEEQEYDLDLCPASAVDEEPEEGINASEIDENINKENMPVQDSNSSSNRRPIRTCQPAKRRT